VGSNNGNVSTSYASVSVVSGGSYVGGLAAYNSAYGGSVSANFWNTTIETGISNGIGYDNNAAGPSDIGAIGMSDANMKTMANFNSATAANGNVNPGWDISASGTGTIWHIQEGVSMPLLPFSPEIVTAAPSVIDEIVEITNQREKPKPEDLVVALETPGTTGQSLPMCN
jgi:hypothetical protein